MSGADVERDRQRAQAAHDQAGPPAQFLSRYGEPQAGQPPQQRAEGYLTLVVEHARLMAVLESSIATLRTLDVGVRTRTATDRLAALGVLTTLPSRLPDAAIGPQRPHLLAAALGALHYPA